MLPWAEFNSHIVSGFKEGKTMKKKTMKITKTQLRKIINEERSALMREIRQADIDRALGSIFNMSQTKQFVELAKRMIESAVEEAMGPEFDMDRHEANQLVMATLRDLLDDAHHASEMSWP